jgi:hypothetical protein
VAKEAPLGWCNGECEEDVAADRCGGELEDNHGRPWSRGAAPERGTSREQDATAAEEPSAVTLGREEAMRGAEEREAASIPLRAPVKSTRPP